MINTELALREQSQLLYSLIAETRRFNETIDKSTPYYHTNLKRIAELEAEHESIKNTFKALSNPYTAISKRCVEIAENVTANDCLIFDAAEAVRKRRPTKTAHDTQQTLIGLRMAEERDIAHGLVRLARLNALSAEDV